MKIKGRPKVSELIIFLFISVFISLLIYFFWSYPDDIYFNFNKFSNYLISGILISVMLWIFYAIIKMLERLIVTDSQFIYKALFLTRKMEIVDIRKIYLKFEKGSVLIHLGRLPTVSARIAIKSDKDNITFINGIFEKKDLKLLYEELLKKNSNISLDDYNNAILNNEKTDSIYRNKIFKSGGKAVIFGIAVAILILLGVLLTI